MISTIHNPSAKEDDLLEADDTLDAKLPSSRPSNIQNFNDNLQVLLPSKELTHQPEAGLNPLVDACGHLFSILSAVKQWETYRQLNKLQKDLIDEINQVQETIKNLGYNPEFILVCRYILCATFDEIISKTCWGNHGQWEAYSLLNAFNQDTHTDKFFTILERAMKDPPLYMDLMELIYICLSMGYKGEYHKTAEYDPSQLEQITHNLYQHIRAYRGSYSKTLCPAPLKSKPAKKIVKKDNYLFYALILTGCVIMAFFISLGYLMDVISNEAFQNLSQLEKSSTVKTAR